MVVFLVCEVLVVVWVVVFELGVVVSLVVVFGWVFFDVELFVELGLCEVCVVVVWVVFEYLVVEEGDVDVCVDEVDEERDELVMFWFVV